MDQRDRDSLIRLESDVEWIKKNMVTKAEWVPVRKIVYGAVTLILTLFLLGVAGLVFVQVVKP